MVGMGTHAFLDFGLRIPVNAMFLVLLVALALATLNEGFGRKEIPSRISRSAVAHRHMSLSRRVRSSPVIWRGGEGNAGESGTEKLLVLEGSNWERVEKGGEGGSGFMAADQGSDSAGGITVFPEVTAADKGFLLRTARRKRSMMCLGLLVLAIGSAWSFVLNGRYGLAQNYCPSEIDTVHRREHGVSTSKLQKALRLNPLNGEYWLSLAMLAGVSDAPHTPDEASAALVEPTVDISPQRIPGWEGYRTTHEPLQEWAFRRALSLSPASSVFWLAWADHLWDRLQNEEGVQGEGSLLEQAARSYRMAVELNPNSSSVFQKAADYFSWQKQKDLPEN
jgi:hypothetical protein